MVHKALHFLIDQQFRNSDSHAVIQGVQHRVFHFIFQALTQFSFHVAFNIGAKGIDFAVLDTIGLDEL